MNPSPEYPREDRSPAAPAQPKKIVPKTNPATSAVPLHRLQRGGVPQPDTDNLAVEEPLEIRLDGQAIVTLMRTPGDDRDLIAGFLLTEGIIQQRKDIAGIAPCPHPNAERPGNIITVTLAPGLAVDFEKLRRHLVASSSCGVCSKASIAAIRRTFPAITSPTRIPASMLHSLPAKLRAAQETFDQTGGLHASAWFDSSGNLLALREDVGRHNALDKLIGHRLLENTTETDGILLVSGRVAFEIVQKALAARFPIIAAISAPTSLAVEFAEENNQTLVGFLRDGRMNIYTHPQRITG